MEAAKGDWNFTAALYSSTIDGEDNKDFNGWQDSLIYYLNAGYKANDRLTLGADFVYNDADRQGGRGFHHGLPLGHLAQRRNTTSAPGASSATSSTATTAAAA